MNERELTTQKRLREALDRLYDREPPQFREYLKKYQENPKSRVFAPLAEAYRRQARYEEAVAVCKQGLTHHPDFHVGRITLARCHLDQKQFTEGIQELERVLHAAPDNLLAQRLLGEAYVAVGDHARALQVYKMAATLSPTDVVLAQKVREQEAAVLREAARAPAPSALDPMLVASPIVPDDPMADETGEFEATPTKKPSVAKPPRPPERASVELTDEEETLDFGDGAALIDQLFDGAGDDDDEENLTTPDGDETFRIEHVSSVFRELDKRDPGEITTSTLGDLYFQQGQYDRALRIYERIARTRPSADILQKAHQCRVRLGVDQEALARAEKIERLRTVLRRVRDDHR
jgi:tetratricopeptide (TPR) repeat protein